MSRFCWTAILALFVVTTALAADFRSVNWGATKKQVIASEKRKPVEAKNNMLGYQDIVSGIKVNVLYKFEKGKLVQGCYGNASRHSNPTDYIDDYAKINELLAKKYGKPDKDIADWKNDMYKDDPQHWGLAVAMGQLQYYMLWRNDRSYISSALTGDRLSVEHLVIYNEKKFFEGSVETQEKETLDQL